MSSIHSAAHNKQLVRRLYEEVFNAGNLALLPELLAEDFIGSRGETGIAEFSKTAQGLRHAFPDIRFRIEDILAEDHAVAVRWQFEATHRGEFVGVPASGKSVVQTGNVIYHCRDGKLSRVWIQADRLGLLQQIDSRQR